LVLSATLAASLGVSPGRAAAPLAVTISRPQMAAPGRVGIVVTIAGLQPELRPTIEGTATVGGQSIQGPPLPAIAARIPGFIDLPAGRIRVGGDASVAEFEPVPPLAA